MEATNLKHVLMELGNWLVTNHGYLPPQPLPRIPENYQRSTTAIKIFTDWLNQSEEARHVLAEQFDIIWPVIEGQRIQTNVTVDVTWVQQEYRGKTYEAGCGQGRIGGSDLGQVFAVRVGREQWLSTHDDCLEWLVRHGMTEDRAMELINAAEQAYMEQVAPEQCEP